MMTLKVAIFIITIFYYIFNSPINCGAGMQTLDENPFAHLPKTDCKDRKLC
jgi:hypothetical protein